MEHYGNDFKTVNLDDILGPIVTDNIFRNKCFLLTCTIPIKTTNGSTSSSNDERQVCVRKKIRVFIRFRWAITIASA